jgi:hypothetical protein
MPPATALPAVLLPPLTLHCRQAAATAAAKALPPPRRCSATAVSITALLPPINLSLLLLSQFPSLLPPPF